MKKIISLTAFFILFNITVFSANAGRSISLPFEENFDSSDYTSDLIWVSNGAVHTWQSTGGWNGGAAHFEMGTSNQPHAGLGQFTSIGATQLNIRFLYYIPSDYCTDFSSDPYNKWIIIISNLGADYRSWLCQNGYAAGSVNPGLCNGTDCDYVSSPRFNICTHSGEWVCYEYQNDISGNVQKLFITTSDGTFNEYEQNSYGVSIGGSTWETIDGIGFFYQAARSGYTYYKIDELKIDDSYIGPPVGFVDGRGSAPSPPRGVTGE